LKVPSFFFTNKDLELPMVTNQAQSIPNITSKYITGRGTKFARRTLPSTTAGLLGKTISTSILSLIFTWNTDSYGYGSETIPLYQSHPGVLAILPNGGVLADATQCCEIDLRKESIIQFIPSASYPVITFGPFASPIAVLKSLSHAFVLGYQQCHWSYNSSKRVREKGIPCDVIWIAIDYMDGFRCFTCDQAWEVWPGPCVVPDFTQLKVCSWWASLVKDFISDDDHSCYHNIYGMLMGISTFEGMKLANENKHPFVLTRLFYIILVLLYEHGLSDQPFLRPDISGFFGNATPKLFGRWMDVSAMFPFCHGHSEKGFFDHEPWSIGEECEEVCRQTLKRCYRFIPHLYTQNPKNPSLGTTENSFLLGPLLVYDLPTLYLQGRSIIPLGPPHQHVGEANFFDDLTLIVALGENGQAKGILFEDDGDGYEFTKGGYLVTPYAAERLYSVVIVRVSEAEGAWMDVVQIITLVENDVSESVATSKQQYRSHLESSKHTPDVEEVSRSRGGELSKIPIELKSELSKILIELKSGDWIVKIVAWIGGGIISIEHLPSGTQWLHSRIEIDGYEEYSATEYRSDGCSKEYKVIEKNFLVGEILSMRDFEHAIEDESLILECDIGGGLVLQRVHSNFTLLHPMETLVLFTSVNRSNHEILLLGINFMNGIVCRM
ncbi:hypothetical protein P3X46_034131, partial [Hevea brasiliensis]